MNLVKELQQKQVTHLEIQNFVSVESGSLVQNTVEKMREVNSACAIVVRDKKLVGIFTVRDLMKKVVAAPDKWQATIDSVMTRNPKSLRDTDTVNSALNLMEKGHFRNVPVLNHNEEVVGNLTHYHIIQFLSDQFAEDVYNIPPNPDKVSSDRDGA